MFYLITVGYQQHFIRYCCFRNKLVFGSKLVIIQADIEGVYLVLIKKCSVLTAICAISVLRNTRLSDLARLLQPQGCDWPCWNVLDSLSSPLQHSMLMTHFSLIDGLFLGRMVTNRSTSSQPKQAVIPPRICSDWIITFLWLAWIEKRVRECLITTTHTCLHNNLIGSRSQSYHDD